MFDVNTSFLVFWLTLDKHLSQVLFSLYKQSVWMVTGAAGGHGVAVDLQWGDFEPGGVIIRPPSEAVSPAAVIAERRIRVMSPFSKSEYKTFQINSCFLFACNVKTFGFCVQTGDLWQRWWLYCWLERWAPSWCSRLFEATEPPLQLPQGNKFSLLVSSE